MDSYEVFIYIIYKCKYVMCRKITVTVNSGLEAYLLRHVVGKKFIAHHTENISEMPQEKADGM